MSERQNRNRRMIENIETYVIPTIDFGVKAYSATRQGLQNAADATRYAATKIGEYVPDSVKSKMQPSIDYMKKTITSCQQILGEKIQDKNDIPRLAAISTGIIHFAEAASNLTGSTFIKEVERQVIENYPDDNDSLVKIKTLFIACDYLKYKFYIVRTNIQMVLVIAIFGEILGGMFALYYLVKGIIDIWGVTIGSDRDMKELSKMNKLLIENVGDITNSEITQSDNIIEKVENNQIITTDQVANNQIITTEPSEIGGTRRRKGTRRKNAKKGGRRKKTCVRKY